MKLFLLLALSSITFAKAHALKASHRCQVNSVVQHYDLSTMKLKLAEVSKSEWFAVTSAPHEDQKSIELRSKNRIIGTAAVWTGTLLNTPEGDLIQAHATFTIENASGLASLTMSLDSRLAKSTEVLETQTATEFLLIPVELKCERNR